MAEPSERGVQEDLEPVVARLRAGRVNADPLELDQIKRTVMARTSGRKKGVSGFLSSRFATVLTLIALLAGTGGTVAVGLTSSHGGPLGGAANAQYKRPKNCGTNKHPKKCPPPKKHHKKPHKKHHNKHHGTSGKNHHKSGKNNGSGKNHKGSSGKNNNGSSGQKQHGSYHCKSHTVGRNVVSTCQFY